MMKKTNRFRQKFKFTNHHDLKKIVERRKIHKVDFWLYEKCQKKHDRKLKINNWWKIFVIWFNIQKYDILLKRLFRNFVFHLKISKYLHEKWIIRINLIFAIKHFENVEKKQKFDFKFVFQNVFEFLSFFRCDDNNQNNFQSLINLIRQKHQNFVQFFVSNEKIKNSFTLEKKKKTKQVVSIENVLLSKFVFETK